MSATETEDGFQRGDVLLVLFPNSDLVTAKRRPVLVVQADDLNTDLDQLVVCMVTGKTFRAGHQSRVLVKLSSAEGEASGLLSDSVVMTDNIATVAGNEIDRKIGILPMQAVDKALKHTLGL